MARNGTLSAKQTTAIDCLLASPSVAEAARRANVPLRTLFRWLADEAFKRELDAAQRALVGAAVRRLAYGLEKSVGTVLHLAESSEDESVRLRAAIAVPTMLRDLGEHFDLAERITALEQTIGANND